MDISCVEEGLMKMPCKNLCFRIFSGDAADSSNSRQEIPFALNEGIIGFLKMRGHEIRQTGEGFQGIFVSGFEQDFSDFWRIIHFFTESLQVHDPFPFCLTIRHAVIQ